MLGLGTSWKTSLFGLGAGALNLLANGVGWKQALFSIGISALGIIAKDHNVTGGEISNKEVVKPEVPKV